MNGLHLQSTINDNAHYICPATKLRMAQNNGYGIQPIFFNDVLDWEGIVECCELAKCGMRTGGWDQRETPICKLNVGDYDTEWPQRSFLQEWAAEMLLGDQSSCTRWGSLHGMVEHKFLNEKGVSKYGTLACDLH